MNKRKAPFLTWLLLLCFAVGQFVLFAHQHHAKYKLVWVDQKDANSKHTTVQERCSFCDQMHHVSIQIEHPVLYNSVLVSSDYYYRISTHGYKGNTLIHADGLSPPAFV